MLKTGIGGKLALAEYFQIEELRIVSQGAKEKKSVCSQTPKIQGQVQTCLQFEIYR